MSAETHKGSKDGDDDAETEVGIETTDEKNKDVDAAVGDEVVPVEDDNSLSDDLIKQWNKNAKAFSLEDKTKHNAVTSYIFSITIDKRSRDKDVVVCACSVCKLTIDIGKYPGDAKSHEITNLLKHRDSKSHKYYLEKASGWKGKENSVAAALFETAEKIAGENVFLLKEGYLQCRLCPLKQLALFGKGSPEIRIRDHLKSSGHTEKEKKNGRTMKKTKSVSSYFSPAST